MPSKESQGLSEYFKWFVSQFPKPEERNYRLERVLYSEARSVGAEASGVAIEDTTIANGEVQVPCKWFVPEGCASAKHVILYMHGGGYSFGSPDGHRKLTAHLAKACQSRLLSVDYRLSPEHKYPAGLDDCVAAYQFLLSKGFAADRVVVAGDSCGGCLSASVPLACLERDLPIPGASISLSPSYDMSSQTGGTMESNKDNDLINTAPFIAILVDRYIGGTGTSSKDPLVSPLFASEENTKKLPPTWISIAGHDMLRDHGERMAEKLKNAGVEVVAVVHDQQQHVMEFMAGHAPEADESIAKIGDWVRKKVGS